jgi:hypothetical protein
MTCLRACCGLVVLAASLSSCERRCRSGTLHVTAQMQQARPGAVTMIVSVSVDGAEPRRSTVELDGVPPVLTMEVDFPNGYPLGRRVEVVAELTSAGQSPAHARAAVVLRAGCETLDLWFAQDGPDGGAPPVDCNTGGRGELCFDGIDNDCDGLVDCEDDECQAGATCQPEPPSGSTPATLAATGTACPSDLPAAVELKAGLSETATCNVAQCACTPRTACELPYTDFFSASDCLSNVNGTASSASFVCRFARNTRTGTTFADASFCGASGNPPPSPVAWSDTFTVCNRSSFGRGCGAGQACVPRAPGACVLVAGSTCPAAYPTLTRTGYGGYTDTRKCNCQCSVAQRNGCQGAALRVCPGLACTTSCSPVVLPFEYCTADITNTTSMYVEGGSAPTCAAPAVSRSGTLTPTGARTLCCR